MLFTDTHQPLCYNLCYKVCNLSVRMIRREVEMRWSNKIVNQGYASLTQQYLPSGMDICFYYDHVAHIPI